jgi:peptidoglycan/xylan/chitin deacetylase (PgdA/CDA1 family)
MTCAERRGGSHWIVLAMLPLVAALLAAVNVAPASATGPTSPSVWHVPVLMYHNVVPASRIKPTTLFPGLYVDPARLDSQMAALRAGGWHSITTAALATAMATGAPLPPRSIIITFDDGRPNNYTTAAPIVEKYGFRATFFVVPGRIGTSREMTAAEITDLAARGHEIANHTMDHVELTTLSSAAARLEIRRGGDAIQAMTGVRPVALAYPYGPTNAVVERAAAAEGIELGFVTDAGHPETWGERLDLHRVRVSGMVRLPDGSAGGGETAAGVLASIAADAAHGPAGSPAAPAASTTQPTATEAANRVSPAPALGFSAAPVIGGVAGSDQTGSNVPTLPMVLIGAILVAALALAVLLIVRARSRRSP